MTKQPRTPMTSDIPAPTKSQFLEEPTMPKRKDFSNPENYEFAIGEYKHKLAVYQARLPLYKECKAIEKEEKFGLFQYDVCGLEGSLLRILEYDAKGTPKRWFCPKCNREPDKVLKRKYKPNPWVYSSVIDDDEKPLKPQKIADDLKTNYLFKTDRTTQKISRYDDERLVWRDDGEIYLKELLPKIIHDRNNESIHRNILHCLKSVTFEEIKPSKAVIAVENGFLHLEKRILISPTPNEFTLTKIPHKFDPKAKCPQILKKLTEIVGEKQLPILLEAIGNIFIIGSLLQKITIFIRARYQLLLHLYV